MSKAKETPSILATRAALSLDSHDCVLGYLRHLPEVGRPVAALAEEEEILVERLIQVLATLRELRGKGHSAAWAQWSEDEIQAALAMTR